MAQPQCHRLICDKTSIVTISITNANMLRVILAFNSINLPINVPRLSKRAEHHWLRTSLARERHYNVLGIASKRTYGVVVQKHVVEIVIGFQSILGRQSSADRPNTFAYLWSRRLVHVDTDRNRSLLDRVKVNIRAFAQ